MILFVQMVLFYTVLSINTPWRNCSFERLSSYTVVNSNINSQQQIFFRNLRRKVIHWWSSYHYSSYRLLSPPIIPSPFHSLSLSIPITPLEHLRLILSFHWTTHLLLLPSPRIEIKLKLQIRNLRLLILNRNSLRLIQINLLLQLH